MLSKWIEALLRDRDERVELERKREEAGAPVQVVGPQEASMSARRKGREGLSIQEALFVEAYLACNCNGTEAARRAGYKGDGDTLEVQASRRLTRANVRDALDARRQKAAVGAWETLQRLSDHARASIEDFLDDACSLDLTKAREAGKRPLVKELTERIIPTKDGDIRQTTITLHDAQTALITLMKHHGLLKDDLRAGRDAEEPARARRDADSGIRR